MYLLFIPVDSQQEKVLGFIFGEVCCHSELSTGRMCRVPSGLACLNARDINRYPKRDQTDTTSTSTSTTTTTAATTTTTMTTNYF